ncbi:DUF4143 domain-containing protein [Thiospirochaeta perfilievii]|uniref:DUF4143 domain-containing protein n=1 Tax=Thiospirochaeta perfilievii TaxID=252967 RepID=UPI002482A87D|nr:DUF4143 domain-containing protein [Thiospirochaeta perfilievii]
MYKLKPFHKNYNKRIVKNPKIYFTDTGLVCSLLGIRKKEDIDYHFLKRSLFETFIVNEFIKSSFNCGENYDLYFWRDNHNKKVDLILDLGIEQYAFEIKYIFLIYGGNENYLRNKFNVLSWDNIYDGLIKNIICKINEPDLIYLSALAAMLQSLV